MVQSRVRGVSPEGGIECMGEEFVKQVGLKPGVKEWSSYGWAECSVFWQVAFWVRWRRTQS